MTDVLHGDVLPFYRPWTSLPRLPAESVGDRPIEGAFRRRSHAFSAQEIHLQAGTAHHDITRLRDRLEGIVGVVQCSKIKHVVVP
jgi:hypothetical protein